MESKNKKNFFLNFKKNFLSYHLRHLNQKENLNASKPGVNPLSSSGVQYSNSISFFFSGYFTVLFIILFPSQPFVALNHKTDKTS